MPDETEDIDLVHARLHTLAALRLPRFKDHLTRLCLRQNFLTHIGEEDIGSLVKLEELDFYDNKLKGVGDALDGLLDLKTLDLSFNLLRSVPHGLERHRYLHTIYFVQNKISKISGVSGLSGSLRSLELGGNRIRTIEGLEGLGQLEELWLGKNKITRLQGLETLKSLRVLSIQSNRITKLEGLEELTNLEEFYISHNGLNKIEGLGKNLKLRTFDVSGNGITTVENLSHLSELEEFWASDNQIATLNDLERELGGIKSLSTIYLERNPCEKEDPTGYRRKVMLALPQTIDVGSVMYDSVMEAVQDQSTRAVVALKTTTTRADDERKSSHEQAEKRPRRERSWTRVGVWRGTGFNNPPGRQFGPSAGFPPLGATHGPAHHFMLATLVGTGVVLTTRTNQRWEGTLTGASNEDGTPGAVLRNAKDLNAPGTPAQEHVFVLAAQIAGCVPQQQQQQQQQQQSQQPSQPQSFGGNVDDLTFGPGSTSSTPWDQFSANEKMFGVEKERKAEIIAKEIMAAASNNPHIAEERGAVDDSGLNEEDKYSSVIRGQNAYIPPGARRAAAAAANGTSTPVKSPDAKSPPPTVSTPVNTNNTGPAPTSTTTTATSPPAEASKPEVPKVAVNGSETPAKPGENNLVGSFREFVTNEKQRLAQKKQAIVKSEKEKRMAELVAFSQSFKLNKPIPKDLVSILTKDSEKAKQIVEKSSADAASAKARQIGGAQVASGQLLKKPAVSANPNPSPNPSATGAGKMPKMYIQPIPPFNPNKGKGTPAAAGAQSTTGVKKDGKEGLGLKPVVSNKEREPSPTSAAAAAREVKCECTHVQAWPWIISVGGRRGDTLAQTQGASRCVFKKSQMMLKEEFNPFKFAKVAEASSVAATAPTQTPQAAAPQPPHPPPPMQQQPTPPVPGPYEEEHARTPYMMYPYHIHTPPMQPMIQVGTPAGPPGYMQPPYMPPMPYPPHQMAPNQPMYGGPMPGMSHMYMPPGPYPPGAQPRPPPHGYYHQSPQLGHAVPYPMMMQGPPGAPTPHQYDPNGPQNGPPGGPLGVGH
ncbi:protein phosphatase 1 regulatory subunit 7 [Rhizoctonia solani]|uniref:Protein phosphatase 1 regulatory subunit 7 n=1 Tax=Rhizoctonia solani TaxID=456999 RepID=A0A8H8SV40_9AGAM|nr:protein phosphatase 1 regulatory subunit 7 [Rhizoctonia solani]QRW18057.1 protein phosphatase 1 regulatory subunit 7 [Rhizoctonia solani]